MFVSTVTYNTLHPEVKCHSGDNTSVTLSLTFPLVAQIFPLDYYTIRAKIAHKHCSVCKIYLNRACLVPQAVL